MIGLRIALFSHRVCLLSDFGLIVFTGNISTPALSMKP